VRVGILTTSFPRHPGDVAGCFVLGFARALRARGHGVEVLCPQPAEASSPGVFDEIAVRHVPYLRPRALQRTFYNAGAPENLRADPLAWLGPVPFTLALTARAMASRGRWDALVSHWALPCGVVAGAVAAGRPHLSVLHSADIHLLSRLPGRAAIASRLLHSASALWFVSADGYARFFDLLPRSERARMAGLAHVEPMGVDPPVPPLLGRLRLRQRLGLKRFTLLSLGRLVPIKGIAEAVEELGDDESLELLVAGDGPERQRLEQLARHSRLSLRLLGVVAGAEKEALLHAADGLLLASRPNGGGRTEGAPTAVLEAMARGLPVIAASTGGLPELLGHGESGLLFDPLERGSLRAAVGRLRDDAELRTRLSRRALEQSSARLWPAVAPRIEALLQPRWAPAHFPM